MNFFPAEFRLAIPRNSKLFNNAHECTWNSQKQLGIHFTRDHVTVKKIQNLLAVSIFYYFVFVQQLHVPDN